MITNCMNSLAGVIVEAPVRIGDVIIKNVANTEADMIATANIEVK